MTMKTAILLTCGLVVAMIPGLAIGQTSTPLTPSTRIAQSARDQAETPSSGFLTSAEAAQLAARHEVHLGAVTWRVRHEAVRLDFAMGGPLPATLPPDWQPRRQPVASVRIAIHRGTTDAH